MADVTCATSRVGRKCGACFWFAPCSSPHPSDCLRSMPCHWQSSSTLQQKVLLFAVIFANSGKIIKNGDLAYA